jgi:biotin synthase
VHRVFHATDRVQTCQLISIKTGGCPEDCAYCPQSAHYDADVERQGLLDPQHVIGVARDADSRGITRMCMGAAWREAPHGRDFDKVVEMVRGVSALGLEVCCTLGMLTEEQAVQLKAAGLTAYNHNLDTSPEFYGSIITTRVYDERLRTLAAVRKAGITVCCGGILGMGEKESDRVGLLQQLATLKPHPESVPINMLVRVEGTPLAAMSALDPLEMVRAIATARIIMPASRVRLAAGRKQLSPEAVTLCFVAGANSIFVGEKLLTTPNPGPDEDEQLLESLGMKPLERHAV